MKKRFLLFCMIACMLVLSACGIANDQVSQEDQQLSDQAVSQSVEILSMIDEYSQTEGAAEYLMSMDPTVGKMVESWSSTTEVLGSLNGVKESKGEVIKNEKVVATLVVEGTNLDPNGELREAEVIFTYDTKEGTVDFISNVKYTFGELMKNAGLNTLLGMGTVFAVLILIMFVIMLFEIPSKMKSKKPEQQETTSVDKAVEQIAANEEAQDDTELIAVISAAIAAYEGSNASGDGYVVRSIRRIR